MIRYVALAKNGTSGPRQQKLFDRFAALMKQKGGWTCAQHSDRLIVFCRTDNRHPLQLQVFEDDRGVILGKVFRNQRTADPVGPHAFLPGEIDALCSSNGRALIDGYWGRYVAFLCDADRQRTLVVRDPMGAMHCYTATVDGLTIVCSDIQELIDSGLYQPAFNWTFISSFLLFPRLETGETGLAGVSELQGGECLELSAGRAEASLLWNPTKICTTDVIEDFQLGMSELEQVVSSCVQTLGSRYRNVLHALSGGLDSAIVLGYLSKVLDRDRLTCYNFYSPGIPESDERGFARIAARHFDRDLLELQFRNLEDLRVLFELPDTAKPAFAVVGLGNDRLLSEVLQDGGFDGIANGSGGDQLFYQLRVSLIAADYARRHGIDRRLIRVAFDVAHLTGESVWAVLRTAAVHGLLRRPADPYLFIKQRQHFLTDDVRNGLDSDHFRHVWLRDKAGVADGKLLQIWGLVDCFTYFGPFERNLIADDINPLVAQPIMDVCLRIPSYVCTDGGVNRALARAAFADILPKEIVSRVSKGNTSRVLQGLYSKNRQFIQDLLMDGVLVGEKLLDRDKLEDFFSPERRITPGEMNPIMGCVCTEIWINKWLNRQGRRAA